MIFKSQLFRFGWHFDTILTSLGSLWGPKKPGPTTCWPSDRIAKGQKVVGPFFFCPPAPPPRLPQEPPRAAKTSKMSSNAPQDLKNDPKMSKSAPQGS